MSRTLEVDAADFAFVQQLLHERTGTLLEDDKRYLVETRLAPLVSERSLSSLAALIGELRGGAQGELERSAIEALVNGETTFFRDAPCFQALRHSVLPALIAARRNERRLVIWSAACSTGQEPYSIAMLLMEAFPELAGWEIAIYATDVSRTHLDRAARGVYTQHEINRGLPAKMLLDHFEQDGPHWLLSPAIRTRVSFAQLNLIAPWPVLPRIDLMLLRNVMIYWELPRRRQVLQQIEGVLAGDGCLVLGAAEGLRGVHEAFEPFSERTPCCFRATPGNSRPIGL